MCFIICTQKLVEMCIKFWFTICSSDTIKTALVGCFIIHPFRFCHIWDMIKSKKSLDLVLSMSFGRECQFFKYWMNTIYKNLYTYKFMFLFVHLCIGVSIYNTLFLVYIDDKKKPFFWRSFNLDFETYIRDKINASRLILIYSMIYMSVQFSCFN